MRITIASSGLGHVTRGIEVWAACLARALAERGQAVTLCKGAGPAANPSEQLIPCWRRGEKRTDRLFRLLPQRLTWRLGLGSPYGIEQSTFAVGLLRYLRRTQTEILHVQDPPVARIIQAARRLGWIKTRTILAHGTDEPLEVLWGFNYLQHLAPWHLEVAREAGFWKPTWTALPNFVDTKVFYPSRADTLRSELGIPADGLVLFAAAAIVRRVKRIDYLVEEVGRLRQGQPRLPVWLVVAGARTPDTEDLIRLGQKLLGDKVRFLVNFPPERMPLLYRSADVFILCSSKEMMPIALLEATASGLPCLVNRHPVLQWMTGAGGEAIDMAAPGALASAVQMLLADGERRRQLGGLARQHCLEHFSRDRVVDQILAYYRFVLTHDRSHRARRPATQPVEACLKP